MKLKANQADHQSNTENSFSGKNAFAFWTMVWLLFVLTIGNLILTITIIGVLKLGRGLQFLEIVPEKNIVQFFGSADLDNIYKKDGVIEGFHDSPLSITGDRSNLTLSLIKANGSMLMNQTGTHFIGINQLDLCDKKTNTPIFSSHHPKYNLATGTDSLQAKSVSSSRITSAIDEDLVVNNTRNVVKFRGSEGIELKSKDGVMSADQVLQLKTHNGSIYISGNGIYLDVKNIPIVEEHDGIKMENKQYKICVCMPQGKLFRVPVPNIKHYGFGFRDECNQQHANYDPCVM